MASSVDVGAGAGGVVRRRAPLHPPVVGDAPPLPWGARWTAWRREVRHDRCLMAPGSVLLLLLVLSLALLSAVAALPSLVIGMLLRPVLRRMSLLVEHLYPLAIARWGHVKLLRHGLRSTRQARHSRTDGAASSSSPGGRGRTPSRVLWIISPM